MEAAGEGRGHIPKVGSVAFADGWVWSQGGSLASARSSGKVALPFTEKTRSDRCAEELAEPWSCPLDSQWRCPPAMPVCSSGNESGLEVRIWALSADGHSEPREGEVWKRSGLTVALGSEQ